MKYKLPLGDADFPSYNCHIFRRSSASKSRSIRFTSEKKRANSGGQKLCSYLNSQDLPVYFGDFPGGLDNKKSFCNAGDLGSIPGSGRSPGSGNGYPLKYSCLENSTDRGAWQATVHELSKSQI